MRFGITSALLFILFATSPLCAVNIEMVSVGNPENGGDVQPQGTFAAVDYNYRIHSRQDG